MLTAALLLGASDRAYAVLRTLPPEPMAHALFFVMDLAEAMRTVEDGGPSEVLAHKSLTTWCNAQDMQALMELADNLAQAQERERAKFRPAT